MKTTRNVIAVDRIFPDMLLGYLRIGARSVQVSSTTPWVNIPIKVPAKLTVSDKVDDGIRMYSAQLMFRTCMEINDRVRVVYRCKTADGSYILIGSNTRPYPVTTVTEPHPDNMTDSQLNEVTVNYTSACPIPIIR